MLNITKSSVAGTFESSDAYVTVEPSATPEVTVESAVEAQFGKQIEQSVRDVVRQLNAGPCKIAVKDRGALDCVIRARVETALRRAAV